MDYVCPKASFSIFLQHKMLVLIALVLKFILKLRFSKNYQFFFLYFLDRKTLKLHFTVLNFTKKTRKSITRAKKRPVVLRRYCTMYIILIYYIHIYMGLQGRLIPKVLDSDRGAVIKFFKHRNYWFPKQIISGWSLLHEEGFSGG